MSNTNNNKQQVDEMYRVPLKFRRIENLHIVFWLLKDMSWALLWKPLGMFMIVPTIIVAIYITIRSKRIYSEFMHNLAVLFWITANCYWMTTEFWFEGKEWEHLRYYSAIPFSIGCLIIAYYYIKKFVFKK